MLLAAALVVLLTSCDNDKEPDDYLYEREVAVGLTEDANVPIVAAHVSGDRIGILGADAPPGLRGAVYTTRQNRSASVYVDSTGRPSSAVLGDAIFLFMNYRPHAVDIGVITNFGSVSIIRDASFDEGEFAARRSRIASAASAQTLSANAASAQTLSASAHTLQANAASALVSSLRYGALATSTAGCLITDAPLPPESDAIQDLAEVLCRAPLANVLADVEDRDDSELRESREAFLALRDDIGCGGLEVDDCILHTASAAADVVAGADDLHFQLEFYVYLTHSALISQPGDVQVTLTWDSTDDLDLWLIDPNGETLSYANPVTTSGGVFEADDVDGFGPENSYWPYGLAPAGLYEVSVHHFSGEQPLRYAVLVHALGQTRIFEGVTFPGEFLYVTAFEPGWLYDANMVNARCDTCSFKSVANGAPAKENHRRSPTNQ